MRLQSENNAIYEFDIIFTFSPSTLPKKRTSKLILYPDYLIIKTSPELKIKYSNTQDISINENGINLKYNDTNIAFIIPSSLGRISDSTTSELFVDLVFALKQKSYTSWAIDSIQKEQKKKKATSFLLSTLTITSILSFTSGFYCIMADRNTLCIFFITAALLILVLIVVAVVLSGWKDCLAQNKLKRIAFHYNSADEMLSKIKPENNPPDLETKSFYRSKAISSKG